MRRAADDRSLLALLGVDERASWEEVRRAFREAVRASHPDLNGGDPAAEQRLKALTSGWEAINTPGKWTAFAKAIAAGSSPGGAGTARVAAAVVTRLRVQRLQQGAFGLIDWNLELDGRVVATIANGATRLLDAAPGRHRLRVFYGSRSSPPLDVQLRRGEELSLGCRQVDNLRVTLFAPKRSLLIEVLPARRRA